MESLLPGAKPSNHNLKGKISCRSVKVLYSDGVPVAVREASEIQFLVEPEAGKKWTLQNALIQHEVAPWLRKYLGKAIY